MSPVCPYCNAEIDTGSPGVTYCTACGAAHHAECWDENGGCTVFGCAAAPPEEPKVTVVPADLQAYSGYQMPPVYPGPSVPAPVVPQQAVAQQPQLSLGGYNPPPLVWQPIHPAYASPPKNRVAYILLGIFLGYFGAHNFYAGYMVRGAIQLAITICTLFTGSIISWIWAIVEVCIVDRDSQNVDMI
jgi:hypothetical protein